jgi:hypothetical protein
MCTTNITLNSNDISLLSKNDLSSVINNEFLIFKENSSICLYGESLTLWLSIGGVTRGDVQILVQNGKVFYRGEIPLLVFVKNVFNDKVMFDVVDMGFGYKVKVML